MSILQLPLELLLEVVSYLPISTVSRLVLTCKGAHHFLRDHLYREIYLDRQHSSQAYGFTAAAIAGRLSAKDLESVRKLALGDIFTDIHYHHGGEFQSWFVDSIIPCMKGLKSLKIEVRGESQKQHQWAFSEKLTDLNGVDIELVLGESFNFSSFICLPFVQRLPSNIVAVTADIRNITSSTLSLLYVALSTLPRLRHLEVTNLPEYLRHPSLFIIPFNFISSGHTFSLSALKSTLDRLAHLDFYPSTSQDLTTHPSLSTSLRELILHMPQLSPEMVSAIFSLQNLTKLRLVEPAGLEEAWALLPSHQPEFTNLKEFGFGSRKDGAWPLKNPHYYFLDSIPHGFLESILSRNPRLERLGLIYLTQSIISVLPAQSLQELEVAFSFDFTGKPTISVQTLTAVFQSGVFKNLCRCYLPFTGLKLNVPFLKTMAGCSMLVDLQIVDGMDGDEGYKKEPQRPKGLPLGEERDGQRYPGGLAGKVLFDVALKEFARWQDEHRNWRMELVHGMCEDQETYVLAEPFLTVGRSPSFNSVNVRCMLDQASLRHRFSGHGI